MEVHDGWLTGARRLSSPNCDPRPPGTAIDLLVIHAISLPPGEFGGPWIDALFTNTLDPTRHPYFQGIHALKVSAHLLIRRSAEVVQYVPFHLRAWHAGESCFLGRPRCNDYSIGIELEGSEEVGYEPSQYAMLADIIHALRARHPAITRDRITGHSEVAPGRKTDPGPAFDWRHLYRLLDGRAGAAAP